MILPTATLPQIGDRITDKSAPPDDSAVREWIGPEAFEHWAELRNWIDEFYPGVFAPDWLYGGKNRGWSLRYKKTKAFTTLVPEYRPAFGCRGHGRSRTREVRGAALCLAPAIGQALR